MNENSFFKLFSHNIPVLGRDMSVVYNLQKSKLIYIPNSMFKVLDLMKQKTVKEVRANIDIESLPLFDEYLIFLKKYDLGFFTLFPEEFPEMNMQWFSPNEIISAIIEYDATDGGYDLSDALNQLEDLTCFHIELRIKNAIAPCLDRINQWTEGKIFKSINIVIEYNASIDNLLADFYKKNDKIDWILVYNAHKNSNKKSKDSIKYTSLSLSSKELIFPSDQYIISVKYFTEALQFHPLFNKKVCIDSLGNLKNDLRFHQSFGNINNLTIKAALQTTGLKDLWFAAPDKVIEYKDDVLRYCKLYTDNLEPVGDGYYKVARY
ncbi:MAG: hypothetical protein QM640_00250 [Niabella sp.]